MDDVVEAVGFKNDPKDWGGHCHLVSHLLVRSGLLGEPGPHCRVVRGGGAGIGGQHSWVVVGDPLEPTSVLIDPTAYGWGAADDLVVTTVGDKRYTAHGYDPRSIWDFGRPTGCTPEDAWEVTPPEGGWSESAQTFLDILGPLDLDGWAELAHYPMGAWPSREIIKAIIRDPGMIGDRASVRLPIDVASLRGDLNLKELYW